MRVETFAGLLDDAAVFPPGPAGQGGAPLTAALPAHRRYRTAWYSPLVGPFVFPAARLSELHEDTVEVSVTCSGSGGLRTALAALKRVTVVAVEVVTDGEDLIPLLDAELPPDVTGYLEVPRNPAQRDAILDALAGTRYRAKFRTGGVVPEAHPAEAELAASIRAAVSRGVPFKCTAGLHHAVRHTDGDLEQHGFLNVLLATHAALTCANVAEVAAVLAERDGDKLAGEVRGLGADGIARVRGLFLSFGTCSVSDPIDDLVALGLIAPRAGA